MDKSKLPRDIAETFVELGAIFLLLIGAVIIALILSK